MMNVDKCRSSISGNV